MSEGESQYSKALAPTADEVALFDAFCEANPVGREATVRSLMASTGRPRWYVEYVVDEIAAGRL